MTKNRKPPWHAVAAIIAGIIVWVGIGQLDAYAPAFVVALSGWCYVLALWMKTKLNP